MLERKSRIGNAKNLINAAAFDLINTVLVDMDIYQTRTQSLFTCMCFWSERRLAVRLRRAGSHGKVRRENSDWQISF